MVHFLAISIFLLPIVTSSGDEFWDDVDMINNDLSDPEELPTQAITTEGQLVESTSEIPHYSTSLDEEDENTLKRRGPSIEKFIPKFVTLLPAIIEVFKRKLIIDESASQNLSLTILEDKLLALGSVHEWYNLRTYRIEKYQKYWAKVCVLFWNQPLDKLRRIACTVSRSYASNKKRTLKIGENKQYFDLLYCRCYTYLTNSKIPVTTPDTFLIHKGNENEFFIFGEFGSQGKLFIKGFKDGITLPTPTAGEGSKRSSSKFIGKMVTLHPYEIDMFNHAIGINNSYPQNVSLEELKQKLMEFEEIHEWPDLFKYNHENYFRYWAKVCVFFWGKRLNFSHRQACFLLPSLGDTKIRKLFLRDSAQHFDLLYCKCHSYVTSYKSPLSSTDTFLIHQSSANEFFIFEQRPTENSTFTLFIRDFKGGITLPNPNNFN